MPSILPTGKILKKANLLDFSYLVYGAPGVGKTTFANSYPDALFLSTESGTELMEAASLTIGSWTDFIGAVEALRKDQHSYRVVVLDTIDLLYPLCVQATCEELGITDPADAEWGRGWRALKTRWINAVHGLRTLRRADGERMCPVFISHERKEPIKERRGRKEIETGRFYVSSDLPGAGRTVLHSAVDFILHAELDEESNRWLRTQPASTPTADIEAKGRGTANMQLPDLIPMRFGAFARTFARTFNPPAPAPDSEPASEPAQE
jgi:hypothetical protein